MTEAAIEPRPVTVYGVPGTLVGWVYVDVPGRLRELRAIVVDEHGEQKQVGIQGLRMVRNWEAG